MIHIKQIDDTVAETWDTLAAHPLQTIAWGEAKKKLGTKVLRFGEYNEDTLVNVYQMTLHELHRKLPFTLGYLQRCCMPSREFLLFIHSFAKKNNLFFIKFEPNVLKSLVISHQSLVNTQDTLDLFNLRKNDVVTIVKSPHPLFPNWTLLLDLSKTIEELKANLHPKNRYNIGLAERKVVVVKETTNEAIGFVEFAKLFFETTKRQKYSMHNEHYHKTVFETMKKANIAHIMTAYYEDKPLTSYELFIHNNVLYYPYGGSSDEYRNVMSANALMWQAIVFGKSVGATKFDMWGSMDPIEYEKNPHDSWAGFTRFKLQFGAQFVEMIGSYDLITNPVIYKVYSFLWPMREKIFKLIGGS
jgi:lipid II:glycine glycyltransferase (peptidoglycan interpeptide bridge formation enzyme)